jgi:hypothetical protein
LIDGVRRAEVLGRGSLALDEVRHRVEPHAVHAQPEPVIQQAYDGVDDRGVVVIQVRLV